LFGVAERSIQQSSIKFSVKEREVEAVMRWPMAGQDTRRIQDWRGHRSIQHTTRYTQLSSAPFKDFWR